jgi:adenine/guanine phosphoribosyltransferase-like PRPP-binding protein
MRQAMTNAAKALNIPLIPVRRPWGGYHGNLSVVSIIVNRHPWRSVSAFR